MELVHCTPLDAARMNEIQWQAMWRYYLLPGWLKPTDESFASRMSSGDWDLGACTIAVIDGEDAGFCWAARRAEEAHCGGFGVRPEFRRRGVGKAVLAETAARLQAHGARVWRLEVVQHNRSAIASYLRVGFQQGRDLALLRGNVGCELEPGESIVEVRAATCLDRYDQGWPQIRRTWGASPTCLRRGQEHYQAKELRRGGEAVAFMLHSGGSVVDIGLAPDEPGRHGLKLIATLPRFSWGNLPDDDRVRPELDACPTVECWVKQWEMIWEL